MLMVSHNAFGIISGELDNPLGGNSAVIRIEASGKLPFW